MEGKNKKIILAAISLLIAAAGLSAQNKSEQKDSLVRLIKAKSLQLIEKHGINYRKTVDATFFHNNTYFICDTALWNVDARVINAEGNVKVVQDGTILTSDSMVYNIDDDLVQFKGTLVQLEDKDHNTLRTHDLDYNTKDSLAFFKRGGAMKDKDGQLIESIDGSYDAKLGLFTFRNNVNMFTDSIFIRTGSLDYQSRQNRAVFNSAIDFWKDDNMLSADRGWYERLEETFFFNGHVHSTSRDQEAWCDSLYYYRTPNNLLMLRNVQVQDTTRNVFALANRVFYEDSLARVTLTDEAAVALRTEEKYTAPDSLVKVKVDTIYIGADILTYHTVRKCDIPEGEFKASEERVGSMFSDPVHDYRVKAAKEAEEAARKAAEENAETNPLLAARKGKPEKSGGQLKKSEEEAQDSTEGEELPAAMPDSLLSKRDSLALQPLDSLATKPLDSLALQPLDSLAKARADSLAIADSLANLPPPDTTRIGFAAGWGNVKIYRTDIQIACDSIRFCEIDSIARFYKDPVVWHEGNRQYSADSMSVLVRNQTVERASLMSNAFIITRETETLFDQIKATEVMAYFDSTASLRRFDALGGANCIFFLKEKEEIGTVYKVDSKMMSAYFRNGELSDNYCFGDNNNDAFPLAQTKEDDRVLKGFKWRPDEQPRGKEDITGLQVRRSERAAYEAHPKTAVRQTEIYFPGYMKKVYAAIEAARNKPKRASAPNAPVDSIAVAADSLEHSEAPGELSEEEAEEVKAPADTTLVDGLEGEGDAVEEEQHIPTKAELREQARQARIAAREARWARADSIDAVKAAEKLQKKLEKQRIRDEKTAEKQRRQNLQDAKKLEKYVEKYRRKYEKQLAREAKKAAREKKGRQAGEEEVEYTDEPIIDTDGKYPGQISEVRENRHPEQRGLGEPALDGQTAEPAEAPVQRIE